MRQATGLDQLVTVTSGTGRGGIRGGTVLGASDSVGESPAERPVTPSDLACTVYHLLGIKPSGMLHTPDGRPVRITVDGSRPISEVMEA
jgi:hypothetical protein